MFSYGTSFYLIKQFKKKHMKLKHLLTCLFCSICFYCVQAQQDSTSLDTSKVAIVNPPVKVETTPVKIYHLKPVVDIPIVAGCGGFSAFAFTKIYHKEPSTEQQIRELDKKNIPAFDRWAAGMSNHRAASYSDNFFYGSMPAPVLLMLDKKMRKDAGKIAYMYLEAFAITGVFYTGTVYFVDRYRPETYVDTNKIPVKDLTSGNYKDAFMGGHPSVVATATFFTSKVYADYHPHSNWRYVFYGISIAATGTTAYLRHIAGKHFPSDLLVGTTVGVLSGMLVPTFHKNKKVTDNSLGIAPYVNGDARGLTLYYAFK